MASWKIRWKRQSNHHLFSLATRLLIATLFPQTFSKCANYLCSLATSCSPMKPSSFLGSFPWELSELVFIEICQKLTVFHFHRFPSSILAGESLRIILLLEWNSKIMYSKSRKEKKITVTRSLIQRRHQVMVCWMNEWTLKIKWVLLSICCCCLVTKFCLTVLQPHGL